jgi:sec-independent protein translocase protein TatC
VAQEQTGRRRFKRRKRSVDPEGRMTLIEHLRELRNRIFWSFVAIALGGVVGWVFYDQLFTFITQPLVDASHQLEAEGHTKPILSITGVADAFNLRLQVSIAAGIVLTSPFWIYQLLRFVTPGLRKNERRWAAMYGAAAVPLFLAGVAVAYFAMPHVLGAFLGFTPTQAQNIISVDAYVSFLLQISLAFGVGFIAPVVIVALNVIGVLSARRFASWWRWVLFFTLVFAAVATPTTDPFNLFIFAAPLLLLMVVAFGICWLNDRRRASRDARSGFGDLSDDEASPLDLGVEPVEPVEPVAYVDPAQPADPDQRQLSD